MLVAVSRTAWCRKVRCDVILVRMALEMTIEEQSIPILGSFSGLHAPLKPHAPAPGTSQSVVGGSVPASASPARDGIDLDCPTGALGYTFFFHASLSGICPVWPVNKAAFLRAAEFIHRVL